MTGDLWSTEEGPQGGDELNLIETGKNYGWPRVSLGRNYDGTRRRRRLHRAGPRRAGRVLGAGDRHLRVCRSTTATSSRPGRATRSSAGCATTRASTSSACSSTPKGEPTGREIFLAELKQRIREVKPGPDGFIYALTDETFGAVLKIEPAP